MYPSMNLQRSKTTVINNKNSYKDLLKHNSWTLADIESPYKTYGSTERLNQQACSKTQEAIKEVENYICTIDIDDKSAAANKDIIENPYEELQLQARIESAQSDRSASKSPTGEMPSNLTHS